MQSFENDEKFRLVLEDHIRTDLDSGPPLKLMRNDKVRACVLALHRCILLVTCNFQRIDLLTDVPLERLSWGQRWARYKRLRWSPPWTYLFAALLCICLAHIAVNMYFQTCYDLGKTRLQNFHRLAANETSREQLRETLIDRNLTRREEELRSAVQDARLWLKWLGSAHLEWAYITQATYLEFTIPAILYMFMGPLYLELNLANYFSFARWILDERGETKLWSRIVSIEMDKLVAASVLYSRLQLQTCAKLVPKMINHLHHKSPSATTDASLQHLSQRSDHKEIVDTIRRRGIEVWAERRLQKHRLLVRRLKAIALDGRLGPMNRTRKWLDTLALANLISILNQTCVSSSTLIIAFFDITQQFEAQGQKVEYASWRDIFEALCQFYVIFACFMVVQVITSMHNLISLDMIAAIDKFGNLLARVISESEIRIVNFSMSSDAAQEFRALASTGRRFSKVSPPNAPHKTVDTLQSDLLEIIMKYRLFMIEHERSLRPFRLYVLIYLYMCWAIPLYLRIHKVYYLEELQMVGLALGFLSQIVNLMFLLPMCQLNYRCTLAYKKLFSLVAQLSRMESIPALNEGLNMELALFTLRRELGDPQQSIGKFACRVLSIEVTYGTIIKMMFFLSLVLIQIMHDSSSGNDLMSNLLDDPFGLFSFS